MYLGPRFFFPGDGRRCARARSLRRDIAPTPACTGSATRCCGLSRRHRASGARLSQLAARYAPDCAQGVFHDYWISLRGADGTTKPRGGDLPRVLCDGRLTYVRPCWYRYFLEQPVSLPGAERGRSAPVMSRSAFDRAIRLHQRGRAHDLVEPVRPDRGLRTAAREGCAACLRGVPDQALAGKPAGQLRLIRECGRMERAARRGCYGWLGERSPSSRPEHTANEDDEAGPRCAGCMC